MLWSCITADVDCWILFVVIGDDLLQLAVPALTGVLIAQECALRAVEGKGFDLGVRGGGGGRQRDSRSWVDGHCVHFAETQESGGVAQVRGLLRATVLVVYLHPPSHTQERAGTGSSPVFDQ